MGFVDLFVLFAGFLLWLSDFWCIGRLLKCPFLLPTKPSSAQLISWEKRCYPKKEIPGGLLYVAVMLIYHTSALHCVQDASSVKIQQLFFYQTCTISPVGFSLVYHQITCWFHGLLHSHSKSRARAAEQSPANPLWLGSWEQCVKLPCLQGAMCALPQLLTQVSWKQGKGATLCSALSYEIHCLVCILALKRKLKKYWFPAE